KIPELDATLVMLLTAKADDLSKLRLLEEGAQDYIVKPFMPEEVLVRVNNLIMLKKAQDISNVETLLENALDAVMSGD
ncbi:MAG: histidine kinase, partial [Pseudobdellovibrio sp.]|nr:histidine kinase [Pseudobdellovibrio sp.]